MVLILSIYTSVWFCSVHAFLSHPGLLVFDLESYFLQALIQAGNGPSHLTTNMVGLSGLTVKCPCQPILSMHCLTLGPHSQSPCLDLGLPTQTLVWGCPRSVDSIIWCSPQYHWHTWAYWHVQACSTGVHSSKYACCHAAQPGSDAASYDLS